MYKTKLLISWMNGSLKQGFLGVFQKLIHSSHFINWVVLIFRGPLGCFIGFASRGRDFAVCVHSWWETFQEYYCSHHNFLTHLEGICYMLILWIVWSLSQSWEEFSVKFFGYTRCASVVQQLFLKFLGLPWSFLFGL